MKYFFLVAVYISLTASALSQMHMETVEYKIGDKTYEGYLGYNPRLTVNRPSILVLHEWWGITPYIHHRVEQLAELGYVVFAADLYGKGIRPTNPKDAQAAATPFYTDRKLFRDRVAAGLAALKKSPHVDSTKIAVIGYCFGGTAALEFARAGANVRGVVSFHGILTTTDPNDGANIKTKVLALTGADDPNVPPAQVNDFEDEMRKGHVDWELVSYGGAVHAFTNPDAGNDPSKGAAYNAAADVRSWHAMNIFFQEIFK